MKFNKQKVMKVLPFVILGYAFNKVSQAFTSAAGTELGDKIMNGMDGLGEVFLNPLPSFNPIDMWKWNISFPTTFSQVVLM